LDKKWEYDEKPGIKKVVNFDSSVFYYSAESKHCNWHVVW